METTEETKLPSAADIQKVEEYAEGIKAMLYQMGGNNNEWEQIDKIIMAFKAGQISTDEVIRKLEKMPEEKQQTAM